MKTELQALMAKKKEASAAVAQREKECDQARMVLVAAMANYRHADRKMCDAVDAVNAVMRSMQTLKAQS